MNRKGFTLVELLAVIVILSIIALIAVPGVFNAIEASRQKANVVQEKIIINAAKSYVAELTTPFTKLDDEGNAIIHYVPVSTLMNENYIEGDDVENIANSNFGDKCVLVTYSKKYSQFQYEVNECE